jgi:endonuclease G
MAYDRTEMAKQFLRQVSPTGGLEAMADTRDDLEGIAARSVATPHEIDDAKEAIQKINTGRGLTPPEQFALEAIIIPDKRPAIDIIGGDFHISHPLWMHFETDAAIKQRLLRVIPSVGRIDLPGHPTLPYAGTGFVVGDDLLMTNRHVAEIFATGVGDRMISFKAGSKAGIDFKRERDRPDGLFLKVVEVAMIHPFWDMALLRLERLGPAQAPLTLSLRNPQDMVDQDVAVIGFPAFDPRNDAAVQNKVFDGMYYVKRLQPGKLQPREHVDSFGNNVFAAAHDSSTLGGNSGSAIFDVATGQVIALHFGGVYLKSNFGVPAFELARDSRVIAAKVRFDVGAKAQPVEWDNVWRRADSNESAGRAVQLDTRSRTPPLATARPAATHFRRVTAGSASFTIPLTITVSLGGPAGPAFARQGYQTLPSRISGDGADFEPGVEAVVADYRDREGYKPDFLGNKMVVDLPSVQGNADDVLDFKVDSRRETELRYEHYSVVMSRSRRMCFFSAVNIDGNQSRKSARVAWKWDPRIPKDQQIMNECYGNPPKFSRGHMTRREDPGWGDAKTAKRGNEDSMHVTNTAPQMQAFNAPIWLALEDYALEHAREDEMKISVFTGPYFDNQDSEMYGVRIPLGFWKVIAFIHDETGKLCATGYEMTQETTLQPEEFVFGAFTSPQLKVATQVSIRSIEARSGISFGKLASVDPLAGTEEAIANDGPRAPLQSLEQIVFVRR